MAVCCKLFMCVVDSLRILLSIFIYLIWLRKRDTQKKTRNKNDTEKVSAKIFTNSNVYEMYVNKMKRI